jgi:hypothetical protein
MIYLWLFSRFEIKASFWQVSAPAIPAFPPSMAVKSCVRLPRKDNVELGSGGKPRRAGLKHSSAALQPLPRTKAIAYGLRLTAEYFRLPQRCIILIQRLPNILIIEIIADFYNQVLVILSSDE